MPRESMTDEEIADLASRIYHRKVFTSYNKGVTTDMLSMIFVPLIFLSEEQKQDMLDGGVEMLYADMKDRGPGTINGMPQFYSLSWCTKDETTKVLEKVEAIQKAVAEATGKKS